jgi:hypothetical protein
MEMALQNSVPYARERMSMRSLSGVKEKVLFSFPSAVELKRFFLQDKAGDRIIWHSDVRRMLLTQKALENRKSILSFLFSLLREAVVCCTA